MVLSSALDNCLRKIKIKTLYFAGTVLKIMTFMFFSPALSLKSLSPCLFSEGGLPQTMGASQSSLSRGIYHFHQCLLETSVKK